jgi:hypothetical protein
MSRPRILVSLLALTGFALVGRYLGDHYPGRFDPVVECSDGHRYRSFWIPGGSLKGLRWFNRRFQWCPVGRHWSWTRRIDEQELSAEDLQTATAVHDLRVP